MARTPLLTAALCLAAPLHAQHLFVVEENFETVLLVSRIDGEVLDPVVINMHTSTGSAPALPVQAIDVGDEVWIPDAGADVIFRFTDDGSYVGEFGAGTPEYGGASRVGNRVWIANAGGGFAPSLEEFDLFGNLVESHPTSATSEPLYVASYQGKLLVSDRAGHDLDLYDLNGNFLSTFHDSDGLVGIDEPRQIHVRKDGNVLVGGSGNLSGIYEYDPTGKQVAYHDTQAQGFPNVRGVHELLNGNYLFTSTSGIHVFDTSTGTVTTNYGGVVTGYVTKRAPFQTERVVTELIDLDGNGQDELFGPGRAGLRPDGTLFVGSHFDNPNAIFRVSPGGLVELAGKLFGTERAESIAAGSAGEYYVATGFGSRVLRVEPDGTETVVIDETGDGIHDLLRIHHVTVDQAGNVYATGQQTDNVFKITPGGVITQILDHSGDGQGKLLYSPGPVVVDDATGDVFIGDAAGRIFWLDSGGGITVLGNNASFDDFVLDPAGGGLFGTDTWGDRVRRVGLDGSIEVLMTPAGDGAGNTLGKPTGIAAGADGTVYVVGQHSGKRARVFARRPDGTVDVLWDGLDEFENVCEEPTQLLLDATESLYVVGEDSHNVFRLGTPVTLGMNYCDPAVVNSQGRAALVTAVGNDVAAENEVALVARFLPPAQPGYFITSQTQGFVAQPGGSQGNLCLGGQIGRFADQVQSSGPAGALSIVIDLTAMPPGSQTVLPGQTWSFQAWYRDKNPGTTSNFSNGVAVPFF